MSHYPGSPEKGPGLLGGGEEGRTFTFDHCLWSVGQMGGIFAGQERLYTVLGEEFLQHSLEGYNCCIFACLSGSFVGLMVDGQTGSGKTHSMVSNPPESPSIAILS